MIPYNKEVTLTRHVLDRWGIGVDGVSTTYKAYVNYKLDLRGNEVNTRNSTLEMIPVGNIILKGAVEMSQEDTLSWPGHDGKQLKAKPDDIAYILGVSGKVEFTKVSF